MIKSDYDFLAGMIRQYMLTLRIEEVCAEFAKKPLLTENNMKLAKGPEHVINYGLLLLPAELSGQNWCSHAGLCKLSCLAFSGVNTQLQSTNIRKGELSSALKLYARRSFFLQQRRKLFLELLSGEIYRLTTLNRENGLLTYVRLNCFSDLDWSELTDSLPECNFYDYTKVPDRKNRSNYTFTFSASERTSKEFLKEKLKTMNVAVVFKTKNFPKSYLGYPVIDGDEHDCRYLDPRGVVVGLSEKVTLWNDHKPNKFMIEN